QNFIGMMQRMGIRAPILLLGGTCITMMMDRKLALVMIATLPLIFIVVYSISRMGVPLYSKVQQSVDQMVRVVREDAQGIRVIKALSKVDYENERYDKANITLKRNETRAGIIMGIVNPIMTLLMNIGIVAVIAVSAYFVSSNQSSATTVIAFMQYFTLISMAMMSLSRMFVMYTKCAASAKRISSVMEEVNELKQCDDDGKGDSSFHISFENVSFSYLGKSNNLTDISFSLKRGDTLGIIGATGSGKSTLLRLLMRFYDTNEGVIRINGKDVRSYSREELTAMFGVVFQNDFLYADSIEENIRFGRDIKSEDIVNAAKIAQAHDFISSFSDGYAHSISTGGTNLSGGQRQRVLISRAIAGNPEILILDDSSSALDYKTDANLRQALAQALPDSTVITVAQRVSSVKNCDLILVIEDGNIIGCGKHEELMDSCAEYKEISDSQMGGAFLD
ncbi:MAG: ABC transporter ATP-binding protein, partial [Clostridia bacterium]|nr:ABC transporter ATP-binding protein [Clostridia bacterium]